MREVGRGFGLVVLVPRRRLFSGLSVEENLRMGMLVRNSPPETLDHVLGLFPVLAERLSQRAGTLGGGEQQMLATARALSVNPNILLVEQKIEAALKVADRIVFLENGMVKGEATPAELAEEPEPLHRYVGIRR